MHSSSLADKIVEKWLPEGRLFEIYWCKGWDWEMTFFAPKKHHLIFSMDLTPWTESPAILRQKFQTSLTTSSHVFKNSFIICGVLLSSTLQSFGLRLKTSFNKLSALFRWTRSSCFQPRGACWYKGGCHVKVWKFPTEASWTVFPILPFNNFGRIGSLRHGDSYAWHSLLLKWNYFNPPLQSPSKGI